MSGQNAEPATFRLRPHHIDGLRRDKREGNTRFAHRLPSRSSAISVRAKAGAACLRDRQVRCAIAMLPARGAVNWSFP